MFKDIGNKIKTLAQIILWSSIIGGGTWLLYSISQYQISEVPANGMINPIVFIISGVVLSYFIYGFGELINHVKNIDYKLNGVPQEEEKEEQSEH